MKVGSILHAPAGLQSLLPQQRYLYLGAQGALVSLGWYAFPPQENGHFSARAYFFCVPRALIEEALRDGRLLDSQSTSLPPWLEPLEGISLAFLDRKRVKAAKTYIDRVTQRFGHISDLVHRAPALFFGESVTTEIAIHARACKPAQRPARIALWLLAYWSTGRNIAALLPPFHHIGNWQRPDSPGAKKLGRPKLSGNSAGFSGKAMAGRIQDSYYRRAKLGAFLTSIWREALREDFGCEVARNDRGRNFFFHPKGGSFPTIAQFRYWVFRRYGPDQVQLTLYGETRVRTKSLTSQGRFAEALSELLEVCEVDAYRLPERPRCLLLDQAAPPLVIARGVCGLSGFRVGVGGSLGGEKGEAYKAMLFTMCVPGSFLARLLGLPITDAQWPGSGLPAHLIKDRVNGVVDIENLETRFPIVELAQAYAGQSKARIESSHPRKLAHEGMPSYLESKLSAIEMFRREFMRAVQENDSSCVAPVRTLRMIANDVAPNPRAIWEYLDRVGRTSAIPIDFATAVRSFLRPVVFYTREDGLYLSDTLRFDSPELRASRFINRLTRNRAAEVPGYVFPLCLRRAFLELEGRICEVAPRLPSRDDKNQNDVSLYELEEIEEIRRLHQREQIEHAQASRAQAEHQFQEATGKKWNSSTRLPGHRPKTRAEAKYEASLVNGVPKWKSE